MKTSYVIAIVAQLKERTPIFLNCAGLWQHLTCAMLDIHWVLTFCFSYIIVKSLIHEDLLLQM
jgi:hypothetical protein